MQGYLPHTFRTPLREPSSLSGRGVSSRLCSLQTVAGGLGFKASSHCVNSLCQRSASAGWGDFDCQTCLKLSTHHMASTQGPRSVLVS